jgi:hypothetical protein
MKTLQRRFVLAIALVGAVASSRPALAGGPNLKCGSGIAVLWPNGGTNVPFNPDRGHLGPLDNAAAVAAVEAAFRAWQDVPSATVSYVNAGPLPVDVDITNFQPFIFPDAPDGLSAILFDDTGEIFDFLFGFDSGVLGVAGPEWFDADAIPCTFGTITEGVALLNGPAFADAVAARDVMVHEFGHYSGLAHTSVNGQNVAFGDPSGPDPFSFGAAGPTDVETMYPFYLGPGSGTASLAKDDIATISTFYPEPSFFGTTGAIAGTVRAPNGTSKLTGIDVVARNLADPIGDAVSALSGDLAFDDSATDPRAGTYALHGLTPGAQYAVYVDGILDGGFTTTPHRIPGPEEFWNGASESTDPASDDPSDLVPVASVAGATANGIDIAINRPAPGPLVLGDDDALEVFPHFKVRFCGVDYDSFFVNSNGHVTFGEPDVRFASAKKTAFLMHQPRIAGLYADLDPSAGGTVSFDESANDVTVRFEDVPRRVSPGQDGGANTFAIRLFRSPVSVWTTTYGDVDVRGGLAGYSCGGRIANGFELPTRPAPIVVGRNEPAVFTRLDPAHDELSRRTFVFVGPGAFHDTFEDVRSPHRRNDTFDTATPIELPFQSALAFSTIEPAGGDVDYYRFSGRAGDILSVATPPGNVLTRTRLGLFRRAAGGTPVLVATGFSALTVPLETDGTYAVAVTTQGDDDFTGDGTDFGRYNLSVIRYRGEVLQVGDFQSAEVPLGFSFPFQGRQWSSVFVNGPGTLTFGAADSDPFTFFSVERFLAGPPRISMKPGLSPSFSVISVIAERGHDSLTIHYLNALDNITDRPNTFSTELRRDGRVRTTYFGMDALFGSGLVGVTPGGGAADPGPVDLSRRPSWPARGTTYEQFGIDFDDLDLSFRTLTFRP